MAWGGWQLDLSAWRWNEFWKYGGDSLEKGKG
jgi:hypothetical protein